MKNKIKKIAELNRFEIDNGDLNEIKAGEAGMCDYACGCSCACETGNNYQANNTANSNAVNTESAGLAESGTEIAVAVIIALLS